MKKSKQMQSLPVLHPFSAGIDIGASFHVMAIAPDLATEPVKTFEAFTTDLDSMANWRVLGTRIRNIASSCDPL